MFFAQKEDPPLFLKVMRLQRDRSIMRRGKARGICIAASDMEPRHGEGVIRARSVQEQRPVRRKQSPQLSRTPTSYIFLPLPGREEREKNRHGQILQSEDGRISLFILLCVLAAQSCLTFCNPMDYSPPGSSVHGILQARILEWVAIPFSRGSS